MKTDLSKYLPVQAVINDFAVGPSGEITAGWRLILPEVFSLNTEASNRIYDIVKNLIKSLPKYTLVHFQHYFGEDVYQSNYDGVDNVAKQWDLNYFDGRPLLTHYCNIYITYPMGEKRINTYVNALSEGVKTSLQKNKKLKEHFAYCKMKSDAFENELNASGYIRCIRMKSNDLLGSFFDYLNQSYDKPVNANKVKSLVCQPWIIQDNFVKIGKRFVQCVSMVGEGPKLLTKKRADVVDVQGVFLVNDFKTDFKVETCLSHAIGIGLPFKHILNIVIEVLDTESVQKDMNSPGKVGALSVMEVFKAPGAIEKKKAIKEFLSSIDEIGFRACKVGINVIIDDTDKSILQKKATYVETAMRNMNGSSCFVENYDNANIFFQNFPSNGRISDRFLYSTVEMAACYVHYETHYRGSDKGFLVLDRYGNPLLLNIRNFPGKTNNNGVIFGPSGTGKSFLTQVFIDNCLNTNEQVVLINVKPDYKHSGALNNCTYIDTDNIKEKGINPFICDKDERNKYICDSDQVSILIQLIEDCWTEDKRELDPNERSILERYLLQFYERVNERGGIPYFKDFYLFADEFKASLLDSEAKFFDFDSFKLVLSKYAVGSLDYVFNTTNQFDILNEKYVAFDYYGIIREKTLFKIYLNYTTHIASQKIKKNHSKGIFTNLIIDEAVDSLEGKGGKFIAEQYRKIRSLNGGIIIATQGVKYLESMDPLVRESIFSNSQIRIMLSHAADKNSIPSLAKYCSIDDYGVELLRDLKSGSNYREYFIMLGGDYVRVLRNEVSEETGLAYSTTDSVVKQVEREFTKSGNMVVSIKNIKRKL